MTAVKLGFLPVFHFQVVKSEIAISVVDNL